MVHDVVICKVKVDAPDSFRHSRARKRVIHSDRNTAEFCATVRVVWEFSVSTAITFSLVLYLISMMHSKHKLSRPCDNFIPQSSVNCFLSFGAGVTIIVNA